MSGMPLNKYPFDRVNNDNNDVNQSSCHCFFILSGLIIAIIVVGSLIC